MSLPTQLCSFTWMDTNFIWHIAEDISNLLQSGPGYASRGMGGATMTNTTILIEKSYKKLIISYMYMHIVTIHKVYKKRRAKPTNIYIVYVHVPSLNNITTKIIYRRSGFDCEILMIAKCEFLQELAIKRITKYNSSIFYYMVWGRRSQLLDSQSSLTGLKCNH